MADHRSQSNSEGNQKISISFQHTRVIKNSASAFSFNHTQWPLDSPEIQATISNPRFPGTNTLQELSHSLKLTSTLWTLTFLTLDIYTVNTWTLGKSASASTTRQQHQISISFQSPPPGSSTTSASLQQGIQPTSC